jgi:hypothetical protein
MKKVDQISFPGKTEYVAGNEPNGLINYDANPDTSGGMPITADVYEKGVVAYIKADKKELKDEKISYRFSKQLLLFLLSFDECTGLTFSKYLKPDGDESLAIVAVDAKNMPLGWKKDVNGFGEGSGFTGAEWAHGGVILMDAKKCLKPGEEGGLDFEKFFKFFTKK